MTVVIVFVLLLYFVVFFSITFYLSCISNFTMILLSVGNDISLIICNNIIVIHWDKCVLFSQFFMLL